MRAPWVTKPRWLAQPDHDPAVSIYIIVCGMGILAFSSKLALAVIECRRNVEVDAEEQSQCNGEYPLIPRKLWARTRVVATTHVRSGTELPTR